MTKVLAIVPARGGSKGVPNKNIKLLCGIPLVSHSIRVAYASGSIHKVVVSTDSEAIADIAKEEGADVVMRPPLLAQDNSLVIDAVRHVIQTLEDTGERFDVILLLEPTSPLRTVDDIRASVKLLEDPLIDSIASFTETKTPPARIWRIQQGVVSPFIPGSNAFLPRQQLEKGYYINGVIYGIKVLDLKDNPGSISFFFGTTAPIMIPEARVVDIDTEMDFRIAEILIGQSK